MTVITHGLADRFEVTISIMWDNLERIGNVKNLDRLSRNELDELQERNCLETCLFLMSR